MRYSFLTVLTATSFLWKSAAGDDAMDDCMDLSGTLQIESDPLLEFSYKVLLDDPEEYNDAAIAFPNGDLTAELVLHRGSGWIGMGMSENFPNMVPAEVVIGLPASDGSSPSVMQYDLSARGLSGVNTANGQTLTDTVCVQNSTHTVLTFTQRLVQDGRLPFDVKNSNNFIYAIGSSNALGYHQRRGTFTTDLRVCEPGTGLMPLPITPPTSPSKSGKEPVELEDGSICVEGYIMDKYCIETLGYLLDRGSNFPTLETADQHSVHCLADVGRCIDSGYEVLTVEKGSDGNFGRQVTLDQYGNEATRALSLQVEKEGKTTGFRATVVGTWDDTVEDDPPVLKVNKVFRSEVGCDGPMPPESEPGLPPPPPTSSPSEASSGQEDITMGETDCVGLTTRVQIRQNPLLELSYKTVLDDPEGYKEATLPNGNITAELVLHRGSGWVGMGTSENYPKMIPGEVVIGLPDASDVMQYDLSARGLAGVNSANGQQLTDTSIVQNSTHTVLTFTQRLVQDGRLPFDVNEEIGLIWAVGFENALSFHQFFGGISLNLLICAPGEGIVNPEDAGFQSTKLESPKMSVMEAHGNILTLAWGLLAPLAIGSALLRGLFIKAGYNKLWFQIHMFLNTTVFILTLIGFIMAFVALNKVDADHFEKTDETSHQLVGLIIMILVFIQVTNGIFRPHLPPAESEDVETKNDSSNGDDASPAKGEKSLVRKIWEPSHKILGVVLLALSWWQVTTGWDTFSTLYAEEDYTYRLWAMVGTVCGIVVIGKVYQVAKTD